MASLTTASSSLPLTISFQSYARLSAQIGSPRPHARTCGSAAKQLGTLARGSRIHRSLWGAFALPPFVRQSERKSLIHLPAGLPAVSRASVSSQSGRLHRAALPHEIMVMFKFIDFLRRLHHGHLPKTASSVVAFSPAGSSPAGAPFNAGLAHLGGALAIARGRECIA